MVETRRRKGDRKADARERERKEGLKQDVEESRVRYEFVTERNESIQTDIRDVYRDYIHRVIHIHTYIYVCIVAT